MSERSERSNDDEKLDHSRWNPFTFKALLSFSVSLRRCAVQFLMVRNIKPLSAVYISVQYILHSIYYTEYTVVRYREACLKGWWKYKNYKNTKIERSICSLYREIQKYTAVQRRYLGPKAVSGSGRRKYKNI